MITAIRVDGDDQGRRRLSVSTAAIGNDGGIKENVNNESHVTNSNSTNEKKNISYKDILCRNGVGIKNTRDTVYNCAPSILKSLRKYKI